MQTITPFLWFDNEAEEAMNFYTSIFKNSRIGSVARYGDAGPGPKGTVITATCWYNRARSPSYLARHWLCIRRWFRNALGWQLD